MGLIRNWSDGMEVPTESQLLEMYTTIMKILPKEGTHRVSAVYQGPFRRPPLMRNARERFLQKYAQIGWTIDGRTFTIKNGEILVDGESYNISDLRIAADVSKVVSDKFSNSLKQSKGRVGR